jgi:hypothetical protein
MYISCEQQFEMDSSKSIDPKISVDQKSQITLEPTTFTKEEIENTACGEIKITTLFAGQHIDVGEISISNDANNLFVVYNVKGNWSLKETHLYVGNEGNLPLGGGGNPKIGHFPYHGDHDLTQSYTFTVPLDQLEKCFVISAHAVVVKEENGDITSSETAFGFGENEFDDGSRWGWYFEYCLQECDDDDDENDDSNDENDDDNDDDDGNNDDGNDDGDNNVEDCINAFAYNTSISERSYCSTYTDNVNMTNAGWSNEFNFSTQQNAHYMLPLYANVDNCDLEPASVPGAFVIGYVDIYIFSEGLGDGAQFFTSVKYVIEDNTYEITDANLYLKNTKFPNDLDPSGGEYNYNLSSSSWNSSENTFENLPWPGTYNNWDAYFIPQVVVCNVID